ncbi:PREDICTED: probable cytochrome P450 12c1, mitochondrial [Amphimedon queenslandica]|uniref:Cytochrome P450 n=1 Tax=Amphimedon queenslandica TaxID=400682 RepID=A0AAN0JHS9_AMPQE|nr:PREDICTED: probable cytochrome P450 12c1, mitochondrial [Amphimedon queenslandica]|eukprot:XP_019856590.1 PREDICTED: probable cytochrome P450 12c1, mitochondrial [Amphimedon queenslandica]
MMKPFTALPSPAGSLPIIGHLRLLKDVTSFSKFVTKHIQNLGPIFKMNFIGQSMVYVADPSAVEKVFRNEGHYPTRSLIDKNVDWIMQRRNEPSLFIFQTGKEWLTNRSKATKQALPANVFSYCSGFNKVAKQFIRNVHEIQNKDGTVNDIRDLVRYWSLEAGAHFTFGVNLDSQCDEDGHAKELQNATGAVIDSLYELQTAFPLYKIVATSSYKQFNRGLDKVYEIGRKYADKYISDIKTRAALKKERVHGTSLIEQWLIEGNMSQDEAIGNAISMLAAGLDTTAATVSFILYELAKHPEVQEKVYQQMQSVMDDDEDIDGSSLHKLPYLGLIIKEAQRLYSVTNFPTRLLDHDIELLGYHIPAKVPILGVMEAMSQDPMLFKDPQKFNPDRWTTDDIHPFIVLPFGFGAKGCWGRRFAEVEIKILLCQLVRHFEMKSNFPSDRLPYDGIILSRPSVPIKVNFTPRKTF